MKKLFEKIAMWILKQFLIQEERKKLKKYERELKVAEDSLRNAQKEVEECKRQVAIQQTIIKRLQNTKES